MSSLEAQFNGITRILEKAPRSFTNLLNYSCLPSHTLKQVMGSMVILGRVRKEKSIYRLNGGNRHV